MSTAQFPPEQRHSLQSTQAKKAARFIRKPHHERILRKLLSYRFLTSDQVTRLLYSQGSASTVRQMLSDLEKAGYLTARHLPRTTPKGSLPKIYTLDRDGFNFLKKQGFDMPKRFRRLVDLETSSTFLPHTLAVNDVLLAAERLQSRYPAISLHAFKHEYTLKQEQAITVTVTKRTHEGVEILDPEGKQQTETLRVIPDLFLDFRINQPEQEKEYRFCLLLEIDLNTEGQRKIRQKVRALLEFVKSGKCRERFGARLPTVGFLNALGGENRRTELRAWTEAELKVTREPHFWTELFVFTSFPEKPLEIDSETLFLSPVWSMPFAKKPTVVIGVGSRA